MPIKPFFDRLMSRGERAKDREENGPHAEWKTCSNLTISKDYPFS
jgi:hypothetical protein